MALCACGESDKEQSVGSDTTVAKTEATAEPAQEATPEPTAEPTPEPTPVPLIEGEVECLPEMLNVGVEDWMMQVGYSIIKMDGSMSFSEILTALENSGLGVKITDSRGEEFHLENRLLRPDDELKANVYKDDTRIMVIDAVNRTEDNVRGNDAGMALEKITMFETNIFHRKSPKKSK